MMCSSIFSTSISHTPNARLAPDIANRLEGRPPRARVPSAPDTLWPRIEASLWRRSVPARPRSFGWIAAAAAVLVLVGALVVTLPQSTAGPELEVVDVRGQASETLGGLIPGFEEPQSGTRTAGSILVPGDGGR